MSILSSVAKKIIYLLNENAYKLYKKDYAYKLLIVMYTWFLFAIVFMV